METTTCVLKFRRPFRACPKCRRLPREYYDRRLPREYYDPNRFLLEPSDDTYLAEEVAALSEWLERQQVALREER